MFQFLIGKVQHGTKIVEFGRWFIDHHATFQFLIGKVQRHYEKNY